MRFHLRTLSIVAILAAAVTPASGGEECSGCSLLGELSVSGPTVDPVQPSVGSEVTFSFPVTYRLPGGFDCSAGSCVFVSSGEVLSGTEPAQFVAGNVVVRRNVAAAGSTTVQLHLRGETEEQCLYIDPFSGCSSYFQSAFIDAQSPSFTLEVVAPTATPTATPTPPRGNDDDGCAIAARPEPTFRPGVLAIAALLLWRLGRRRRRS